MQIFKDTKKFVTGITYKHLIDKSVIISDKSITAKEIKKGKKFDIKDNKIILKQKEIKKS